MRSLTQSALMLLIVLSAVNARADILFIDANNSPSEIVTARRAAEARGEKLLVIPDKASAAGNVKPLNAKFLDQQVTMALKAGRKFDSVIISGETIGNRFFGKNGEITDSDIVDVVKKSPTLSKSVRSLYGLGCYSATLSLATWWKTHVPSLEMVVGYDGQAPYSSRQPGLNFLVGALLKEKQIVDANEQNKSSKDIEQIIRSIPDFNLTHGAVYTDNACYSGHYGSITSDDFVNRCTPQSFDVMTENVPSFFSMLNPQSIHLRNVPCDRDHSWLRSVYDQLRNHQQCGDVPGPYQASFKNLTNSAEQVIRLIYFSNVLSNFEKVHKSELDELAAIASKYQPDFPQLNLNVPFACDSKSGLNRPQITSWIEKLAQSESPLTDDEKKLVTSLQSKMKTQLNDMNCVPDSWIESPDTSTPKDASPDCFKGGEGHE
jgi:hypothetical protein